MDQPMSYLETRLDLSSSSKRNVGCCAAPKSPAPAVWASRRHSAMPSVVPEAQHGAGINAPFAQCGERLAGPNQRKGCRCNGLHLTLLVKAEDFGEASGDLRGT